MTVKMILMLLLVITWVMTGFFTALLMRITDEIKGTRQDGKYWIKNSNKLSYIIILLITGPLSLILSLGVMGDLCMKKKL